MNFVLEEIGPDGPLGSYTLQKPRPILVGRGRDCTIRLEDTRISRHHCVLSFSNGKWHVEDLGSTNGTAVNGQKIKHAALGEGDTITLGRRALRYRALADEADTSPEMELEPTADVVAAPLGQTQPDAAAAAAPTPTRAAAQDAARLIGRRYELGEIIHQGSSGSFFRAKDLKNNRPVCLKILSGTATADPAELKRFVRGVRTAAKLHHPNIVQLFRAGQSGGRWWLAMELVDGPSLRQVVAKYGVGNMLSPARVLAIARDITAALEVAYERQVLHRNIRPENILLAKGGIAKLSDFALVRGVVLTTLQRITASHELVGDLAYMAPERTEPDGAVDCRADIYSLGACLYTLLAGRPPFTGRGTVHLLQLIRHEEPPPPSRINMSVPGPLEGIVMKCLVKSPTDRFQSPMELREELARVARFQGVWT